MRSSTHCQSRCAHRGCPCSLLHALVGELVDVASQAHAAARRRGRARATNRNFHSLSLPRFGPATASQCHAHYSVVLFRGLSARVSCALRARLVPRGGDWRSYYVQPASITGRREDASVLSSTAATLPPTLHITPARLRDCILLTPTLQPPRPPLPRKPAP